MYRTFVKQNVYLKKDINEAAVSKDKNAFRVNSFHWK